MTVLQYFISVFSQFHRQRHIYKKSSELTRMHHLESIFLTFTGAANNVCIFPTYKYIFMSLDLHQDITSVYT